MIRGPSREQIAEVLRLRSTMHFSYSRIAEETGVSSSTVQNICESQVGKHPKHRSPANIIKLTPASPRPPLRPAVTDPSLLKKITAGR